MIVRIVKMIFESEHSEEFLNYSLSIHDKIVAQAGCLHMEILRDVANPNIFFTYSHWESEEFLNLYRESDFFTEVWSSTKKWFADKPQAWTTIRH